MDATNVTVKEEPPETADEFTATDSVIQDVAENGIEMKTFVFDGSDGPPQLMPEAFSGPSEVSAPDRSQRSVTAAPRVYRIHRRQEQHVVEEVGARHNCTEFWGRLNHCNGYRMEAMHVTPGGILFWRCWKHALFRCAGSAMSRSPHARLVQRSPHNHEVDEVHQKVLEIFRACHMAPKDAPLQSVASSSVNIQRSGHCQEAPLLATTSQFSRSASPGLQMRTYRLPHERCPGRYALCEGHRMASTVRKDNGDIVWRCVHATSLKCRGMAASSKDNEEELTATKPHNHPPLILGPKQKIPAGIDKSTLLLSPTASPSEASTPINLSRMSGKQPSTRRRIALCNGYYMRESYTTKEGVTTWYCCRMQSLMCKAMAESNGEKPELVLKRPHSHAPALPYDKKRGRPPSTSSETKKMVNCHEVAEFKEGESAESGDTEPTQSSSDDEDSSDQEFNEDIPKVQRNRDLLRCDKYAVVEGYPMRCHTAVSTGTSYWQCRREGKFKCKAFAISDLDGSTFKMTQPHNHPPGENANSYGLLKLRDRWKPNGDSKPPGRPRKHHDKPLSKKNFDLLKCDIFATVDGYLMRCMNVAAKSGKSWWFCRVHGRFKCRGGVTSDLYGREFVTIREHNHPASDGLRSLRGVDSAEQRVEAEATALAEANGLREAYVDLSCNDSLMDHDY